MTLKGNSYRSLHPLGWLSSRKHKISVGEDVEGLDPWALGNINGTSAVENRMRVPPKITITLQSRNPTSGYIP